MANSEAGRDDKQGRAIGYYVKIERGSWVKDGEKSSQFYPASGFTYSGSLTKEQMEGLDKLLRDYCDGKPLSAVAPTSLRELAERCRPAVARDAKLRDMDTRSDLYAHSYRPVLEEAAQKAQKLLDDIDAILAGTPVSATGERDALIHQAMRDWHHGDLPAVTALHVIYSLLFPETPTDAEMEHALRVLKKRVAVGPTGVKP